MESLPRVNCISCFKPCSQLQSSKQDADAFYETFYCIHCLLEIYAIKCGYCSAFVSSLITADVSPGAILKCPNQACKKESQYLTCPNSACRKVNYRPGNFMMGTVTQCDYCKVKFQDVTCNLCHTENYFRGDPSQQSYYRSGIRTNCRGCKGTFLQFSCPTCKQDAYTDANKYNPSKAIECGHCQRSFKQTSCAACKRSNFYVGNTLKFGMLEKCACNASYRTYYCQRCGEFECQLASLITADGIQDSRRIIEQTCKRCSQKNLQVPCSQCGLACYLHDQTPGPQSLKCRNCPGFTAHVFNCTICRYSYFDYNQMTRCPNVGAHSSIERRPEQRSQIPSQPQGILRNALQSSPSTSDLFVMRSSREDLLFNPATDDLTKKINNIKETDDTPTEKEEKRCCVCLCNEKKTIFIPCGHLSCCLTCTKAIIKKDSKCPVCKQIIKDFQQIYAA